MARTFTAPQRSAIAAAHVTHSLKLEIEDPDGAYVEVSADLDTPDWLTSFRLEEDHDSHCMTMSAILLRDTGIEGLLSLAPLREDSTLNVDSGMGYAPMLDVARKWRASVSVVAYGSAPSYVAIGEGLIDTVTVNDPEPTITITGRCFGAMLLDRWIEEEREYSLGGADSMETVIDEILDDNGLTGIAPYTPVSPSFTMVRWKQGKENVMSAINTVARLAGMSVRFRYDASDVFRLTLSAPDRTAVPTDEVWELGPTEYTALPTANLDLSGVRNRVNITYRDDFDGSVDATHTEEDATSIARYGGPEGEPRTIEIDLAKETNVTTAARAEAFALAVLSDLKDPPFKQVVAVPGFWIVQLGDYGKLLANGVHYDTDQYGGVTRIAHEFERGEYTVTLSVGGQPSARYAGWITMAARVRPDLVGSAGTVAVQEDGAVAVAFSGADWVGSHRYATSTSAFPTLATVRSSGTNLDGRQSTFALAAATLDLGESIYITVIPYSLASSVGYEGPSLQMRGTRHDHSASKTVFFPAHGMRFNPNGSTGTLVDSNGYISPLGTTDGDAPFAVGFLLAPQGCTVTEIKWLTYQGAGTSNFIRHKLARLDSSAGWGYVDLSGDDDTTNVGQQELTSAMSESTTGRRYKVTAQFAIQAAGGAATEGDIRFSGYSVTYTMPSTVNSI